MEISELHNNLGLIEESNLVLDDYIIGRSELGETDIINSNVRKISPDELKHSNVFITFNKDQIGITCVSNKILLANGLPFNCSDQAFWTNSKVITTKTGIIDIITSTLEMPLSFNLIKTSHEEIKGNFSTQPSKSTSLQN